jgi:23S rRNA (cytosine1962-C5)-methyltransferase
VDIDFFHNQLSRAIVKRGSLSIDPSTSCYREVYGESDGLPGLNVDRYNEFRVIQFLSAGTEHWREEIIAILREMDDCEGLYERSDVDVRGLEGLSAQKGPLWGKAPESLEVIQEHSFKYYIDIPNGQKTGFYLDQRENRQTVRTVLSNQEVLNCFAYTGGFTVMALAAGAERVTSIESSASALELASENVALNKFSQDECEWIEGDVSSTLRTMRDRGRSFDAIILDPPRFARSKSQVQRASRGYKDINLMAFKLLRAGGLLITFSCSGAVSTELFQKIVAGAALDAGVDAGVIGWLSQPVDHPVHLNFPEARYLKGLICRVDK